ncbi:MAG TPA: O-antigen ligase family protein [Stellaceae bacterium]|nr:O-antigen ligase family protein [Stellaceae bacterium]
MIATRIAQVLAVALIALAPLPFGSNRPWAWSSLGVLAAILLLLVHLTHMPVNREHPPSRLLTIAAGLFGLVLIWAGVQILPLTPEDLHHPFWADAAATLSEPLRGTISISPWRTVLGIYRFVTYAAVFWSMYKLASDSRTARLLVNAVVISGAVYAAYGFIAFVSGSQTILWFEKWAYQDDLTSVFVNRNSYATYNGLCLTAAVGMLIVKVFGKLDLYQSAKGVAAGVLEIATREAAPLVVAVCLMMATLLLSHSRMGLVATMGGLAAMVVSVALARSVPVPRRWPLVIVIGVALCAVVLVAGGDTLDRLTPDIVANDERGEIYRLTLQGIADQPWLGTGLGSFGDVFGFYRTPLVGESIDFAHNSYLENAFELGIPSAACLILALLLVWLVCVRGMVMRRRDGIYPCIGVAATVLVGLHSMTDFSLQIPAVTVTYLSLLAVGAAQSRRQG